MSASEYPTVNYDSTRFVESAGVVLFRRRRSSPPARQICLVHSAARDQWLLAKGRRNIGESRAAAAAREAREETGHEGVRLLPVRLRSRCPPADERPGADTADVARGFEGVVEPFMVTRRMLPAAAAAGGEEDLKLIWWYVGVVDEGGAERAGGGEEDLAARWVGFGEALDMLTFRDDREIVRKAIEVFETTERGG